MNEANMKHNFVFLGFTDDYYKYYLGEIDSLININNCPTKNYSGLNKIFSSIFLSHRLNRIVNIPFKSLWLKGITYNQYRNDKPFCFILHGSYEYSYTNNIVKYIKRHFNGAVVALYCTDKISLYYKQFGMKNVNRLLQTVDYSFTYNKEDSISYNMELMPPTFPYFNGFSFFKSNSQTISSDLFFVGKSKGRHKLLHQIYKTATEHGYNCDFTILEVPEADRLNVSSINYSCALKYDEVIKRIKSTKCILNLVQDGGAGLALRDYEAIYFDKYLLTNNDYIFETKLFCNKNSNQIIKVDRENIEEALNRIGLPYTSIKGIENKYSWRSFLLNLDTRDYSM